MISKSVKGIANNHISSTKKAIHNGKPIQSEIFYNSIRQRS